MNRKIFFGDRMCGEIIQDTYVSHRYTGEHFYKKGGGYPITNEILKVLKIEMPPVLFITIVEHGVKATKVYKAPLQKYLNAVLVNEGGFEPQRCVPLKEMELISTTTWKQ